MNCGHYLSDEKTGFMWLKRGTELNQATALFELATYNYGTRSERIRWAERAIELGDINALYVAMCLYRHNNGEYTSNMDELRKAVSCCEKYIDYIETHSDLTYKNSYYDKCHYGPINIDYYKKVLALSMKPALHENRRERFVSITV